MCPNLLLYTITLALSYVCESATAAAVAGTTAAAAAVVGTTVAAAAAVATAAAATVAAAAADAIFAEDPIARASTIATGVRPRESITQATVPIARYAKHMATRPHLKADAPIFAATVVKGDFIAKKIVPHAAYAKRRATILMTALLNALSAMPGASI